MDDKPGFPRHADRSQRVGEGRRYARLPCSIQLLTNGCFPSKQTAWNFDSDGSTSNQQFLQRFSGGMRREVNAGKSAVIRGQLGRLGKAGVKRRGMALRPMRASGLRSSGLKVFFILPT